LQMWNGPVGLILTFGERKVEIRLTTQQKKHGIFFTWAFTCDC